MNGKLYIMVVAGALAACAAATRAADAADTEALAEKQGDALKLERAAELDAVRELENVSPTPTVAVKSFILQPISGGFMDASEQNVKPEAVEESRGKRGGVPSFETSPGEAEDKTYHEGRGDIQVSVDEWKITKSVPQPFGDPKFAKDDWWYVWVKVSTINKGKETKHVNPNHFTLSTPGGYTTRHDTETYSLDDSFDAVDLPRGGWTGGWLIFKSTKEEYYKLNYFAGWDEQVTVDVRATEDE